MKRRLAVIMAADMAAFGKLIERNEVGVLSRQHEYRRQIIVPEIERCRGRIVKSTGDGWLAEFVTPHDALRCAIDLQNAVGTREAGSCEEDRIQYRIGLHVGEIVEDDDDIFGDTVNLAARLESIAEPGGVCSSDLIHQMIGDRISEPLRDLGMQRVKNIRKPVRVWQWTPDTIATTQELDDSAMTQRIQFCLTDDEVQIAWAAVGDGRPVLRAPHYMCHLEYEWRSPFRGPALARMAREFQLVRFDQRGNGLSDWDVPKITEEAMIRDMSVVVSAAGLKRFAILGVSQGAAYAIRYAAQFPEQVNCLVISGGYSRGALMRGDPNQAKMYEAVSTMIREGWGSTNPVYRQFFTMGFMPNASPLLANSFDEFQRLSSSPENATRIYELCQRIDVSEFARELNVPTLILHAQGDRRVPFEEGRRLASLIRGARFIPLEGDNHVPLPGTPAFDTLYEQMVAFVNEYASDA